MFSLHCFNLPVFSPRRRDYLCLYCCHFTANDLGFGLPSVCRNVTRPLFVSLPFFSSSFSCFTRDHFFLHTFFPFFFSLSLSLCVYVSVSPVLTPPESEKADSEDRVSLKVCSQRYTLLSAYFFLVKMHSADPPQTLHPFLSVSDFHMRKLHITIFICLFFSVFVRLQRE